MRLAIPLIAFMPYKAEAAPGVISTLAISSSVGPIALPSGTPNVADCMSTPSTSCTKRKLLGILKPRVLGILNVKLEVVICTPLYFEVHHKSWAMLFPGWHGCRVFQWPPAISACFPKHGMRSPPLLFQERFGFPGRRIISNQYSLPQIPAVGIRRM